MLEKLNWKLNRSLYHCEAISRSQFHSYFPNLHYGKSYLIQLHCHPDYSNLSSGLEVPVLAFHTLLSYFNVFYACPYSYREKLLANQICSLESLASFVLRIASAWQAFDRMEYYRCLAGGCVSILAAATRELLDLLDCRPLCFGLLEIGLFVSWLI